MNRDRGKHPGTTCVELVGRWMEEHALRHLCANQCFLRAFAPSREWMILRKTLENPVPIGEILRDWTCRLVHETERNSGDVLVPVPALSPACVQANEPETARPDPAANHSSPKKPFAGNLPRTVFVSLKSGESFPSFQKGRKYMLGKNYPYTATSCSHEWMGSNSTTHSMDQVYYKSTESRPTSPFGLLEELFSEEPWRVLICTMFLNKTQRKQNLDCILFHLFQRWPTAESVAKDADDDEEAVLRFVFSLARPAGLGRAKAMGFVRLSRDYMSLLAFKNQQETAPPESRGSSVPGNEGRCKHAAELGLTRKEVKQLFNCGDYAADAYQIFVGNDFESPVLSNDRMLLAYVEWKRSISSLS